MNLDIENAVTPCPACASSVRVRESRCPSCGASMTSESSFTAFQRPDGSRGLMDQATLKFLRSAAPRPSQESLNSVLDKTTHAVISRLEVVNGVGTYQPVLELADPADLAELARCMHIESSGG